MSIFSHWKLKCANLSNHTVIEKAVYLIKYQKYYLLQENFGWHSVRLWSARCFHDFICCSSCEGHFLSLPLLSGITSILCLNYPAPRQFNFKCYPTWPNNVLPGSQPTGKTGNLVSLEKSGRCQGIFTEIGVGQWNRTTKYCLLEALVFEMARNNSNLPSPHCLSLHSTFCAPSEFPAFIKHVKYGEQKLWNKASIIT